MRPTLSQQLVSEASHLNRWYASACIHSLICVWSNMYSKFRFWLLLILVNVTFESKLRKILSTSSIFFFLYQNPVLSTKQFIIWHWKLFDDLWNRCLKWPSNAYPLQMKSKRKIDLGIKSPKRLKLSVFTRRHGSHVGVPKQWNGGHVGVRSVLSQSCGNTTVFLCKHFILFQ